VTGKGSAGQLIRRVHESQRCALILLTDEGRALAATVAAVSDQLLSSMAKKLTERELETLTLLLARAAATI
jgi:DNA-binding MarR family transcriptional regulator